MLGFIAPYGLVGGTIVEEEADDMMSKMIEEGNRKINSRHFNVIGCL